MDLAYYGRNQLTRWLLGFGAVVAAAGSCGCNGLPFFDLSLSNDAIGGIVTTMAVGATQGVQTLIDDNVGRQISGRTDPDAPAWGDAQPFVDVIHAGVQAAVANAVDRQVPDSRPLR